MNSSTKINIIQYRNGVPSETIDDVVSEKRLKIFSNDKEILSLLCTPTMVKELVVGFALSEGLLKGSDNSEMQQIWCAERIEIFWRNEDIDVHLPVETPEAVATLTSGCGRGVSFTFNEEFPLIHDNFKVSINTIFELYRGFQKRSELFRTTGGAHIAALCDEKGIIVFAEDIGRHNAVDKIIGYAFLENIPMQGKIMLLSGRLSSEIATKAVRASVPILVSRAAPTDMAVELSKRSNITLIGFLRGQRLNVYSGLERIIK
jgi:FdhD protein